MRLTSGEIWPIPITLATDLECQVGDVVELSAPNGKALGRLTVEEIYEKDVELEAEKVYRTTDNEHPGVAAIREEGTRCIAGPIEADALPDHEEAFMKRYQTAEPSRSRRSPTAAGSGSSPSRPATRSTGPTSTSPRPRSRSATGSTSTR